MTSKFFTNQPQNTIFEKFKGVLNNMQDVHAFHSVVGYFRSSGYFALRAHLAQVKEVKILVGINVDKLIKEAQNKGMIYLADKEKVKDEFSDWYAKDLKEADYSQEIEQGMLDFIQDIVDNKIEVRVHNSQSIHAKFYLFLPQKHTEHSDGWVIMGSSNFTEAGLGVKKSSNYELNIALKDYDDVKYAIEEFKKLWEDATHILPEDIKSIKKTHIGQQFTPYEVYLKLLIEYFGSNIEYNPDIIGDLPLSFKKLSYQIDAVNEGYQMLSRYNGFFLSDVVGLGKTVIATMIAKRFINENGNSTKILVIFPPALKENWKGTFKKFGIEKYSHFISNGSLQKILEGHVDYNDTDQYDLILVDEAHKFRNHESQKFDSLQKICKSPRVNANKGLVSGESKKVILISATPLNNKPEDLRNQLLLFQDARKSTLPITNLQSFFAPIIEKYQKIISDENPDIQEVQKLYKQIREKIFSHVTVRRTRKDLQNYPKYLEDLEDQGITFPKIAPLQTINYKLDKKLIELFETTIFTLMEQVNYYRYQAVAYLKDDIKNKHYENATVFSDRLANIMKILLIKRLESSIHAFRITLQNIIISTQQMIDMFDKDKVLIAPSINIKQLLDQGNNIEDIEEIVEGLSNQDNRTNIFKKEDFKEGFDDGLREDKAILTQLLDKWENITQDPKLTELINSFDKRLLDQKINPTGKVIIFTESNDTAEYLKNKLEEKKAFSDKVLKISADNRARLFDTVQKNFDANYEATQQDDYQFLITTDAFSEGVNLHRANVIINYDTPWNATRLMQRIGRINRIGSVADAIYNFNFYPSIEGDKIIQIYNKALVKLQGFHSAFGEDNQVYTEQEMVERFELFNKEGIPDEEDKRLEYLDLIRQYKEQHPTDFERIQKFPLKARTIRQNQFATDKQAQNSTIIFLKSSLKTEFYQISKNEITNLSFLEVAKLFEAEPQEQGISNIPAIHYDQVKSALKHFEDEFRNHDTAPSSTANITVEKADVTSKKVTKFLRNIKNNANKDNIDLLIDSIEKGKYAQIPKQIKKLQKQLENKKITYAEIDKEFATIVSEYSLSNKAQIENDDLSSETPEIIISATFYS